MKKYKLYVMSLLCFAHASTKAQLYNNGATLSVTQNANVMLQQTEFINQKGDLTLNGWLGITGNAGWTNNDAASHALNLASTGTVELLGKNQVIGGTNSTTFYNLWLSGDGLKSLSFNQEVSHELDLSDRELALDKNNLFLSNTNVDAVKRTSGFLSSGNVPGSFIRATTVGKDYLFPTGSSTGSMLYRPVVLKSTGNADVLSVAFIRNNPLANGLNSELNKKTGLYDLNTAYYHQVQQLTGTGLVDVNVLFNGKADGDFKELAFYIDKWTPARAGILPGLYGDNLTLKASKLSFNMKDVKYFALANQSATDMFIPNSFSPNGDGKNDKWIISSLDQYPDNQVRITNRWGDEVYSMKSYNSSNAFDGDKLNEGTYYYFIKLNVDGVAKTYAGYFTLLR